MVDSGKSLFDGMVKSANFELFLDVLLNRKHGVFWRLQQHVVYELLRQEDAS